MPRQASFDLIRRPALGRDDYFVTPANATALRQVEAWRDWPGGKLMLVGPEASGKTHLAHVWAAQAGARLASAAALGEADVPALIEAPLALEDVEGVAGDPVGEEALLHLFNLASERRQPLLMTARGAPAQGRFALPDLASRLRAVPTCTLPAPDDILLSAVLMKLLAERGISCDPDLIAYAAARMERRLEAAQSLAAELNREAFSRRQAVTKPLIRAVLDKMRRQAS